jgi:hypothetical protein
MQKSYAINVRKITKGVRKKVNSEMISLIKVETEDWELSALTKIFKTLQKYG